MPWMTENPSEYNPKRDPRRDWIYIHRGKKLIETNKHGQWEYLVTSCSSKKLDRDVEFTLALDALELLRCGMDPNDVASIFADSVQREVDLARISPVQGCIARDLVREYSSLEVDFGILLPEESYLHLTQQEIDRAKKFKLQ